MEEQGLVLSFPKNDKYKTPNGAEGLKTYGSGTFTLKDTAIKADVEIAILTFQAEGIVQQALVMWDKSDTYADQIAQRVLNSVELQAPKTQEK